MLSLSKIEKTIRKDALAFNHINNGKMYCIWHGKPMCNADTKNDKNHWY